LHSPDPPAPNRPTDHPTDGPQVTGINLRPTNLGGATFAILLPASGECSTPSDYFFSGVPWFSFFNEVELNSGCCGTGFA
jgi:hypothetical protein